MGVLSAQMPSIPTAALLLSQLLVSIACSALLVKLVLQRIRQALLRNIPGPDRHSFLTGNLARIFDPWNGWNYHTDMIAKYGRVIKIHAFAGDTQLYISDPKALHSIIIKDQHIFEETSSFIQMNRLTFGTGLLSTLGEHHRQQRKLLNPVFSINHMRYMIPIFKRITYQLRDILLSKLKEGPQETDILYWMTGAALEMIGQGGLGYSFDALNENSQNKYGAAAKNFAPSSFALALYRPLIPWLVKLGTPRLRRFVAEQLPFKRLRRIMGIVDVMNETSRKIFAEKKAALLRADKDVVQQLGEGRDIMSILLKANMKATAEDRLPDEELLGQMNMLLFAGMDTTTNALARTFHLLAQHQDVQDKLRDELTRALEANGELDYDDLHTLPFLDAVCRESLRVYPPVSFLGRTTRSDVVLPLGSPIVGKDGREISQIHLPKNTDVLISILGVNRDPSLWGPDAAEWKPERWLLPLPESVTNARVPGVYSNTLTFLGGGRACIGFKFSQLEMKMVLATLVPVIRFSLSKADIIWRLGGISNPVVKGSDKPSLPLRLSLVKDGDVV